MSLSGRWTDAWLLRTRRQLVEELSCNIGGQYHRSPDAPPQGRSSPLLRGYPWVIRYLFLVFLNTLRSNDSGYKKIYVFFVISGEIARKFEWGYKKFQRSKTMPRRGVIHCLEVFDGHSHSWGGSGSVLANVVSLFPYCTGFFIECLWVKKMLIVGLERLKVRRGVKLPWEGVVHALEVLEWHSFSRGDSGADTHCSLNTVKWMKIFTRWNLKRGGHAPDQLL